MATTADDTSAMPRLTGGVHVLGTMAANELDSIDINMELPKLPELLTPAFQALEQGMCSYRAFIHAA